MKILTCLLLLAPVVVPAQKLKKEDKAIMSRIESHVRYLADDKLEGRSMGSAGEKAAAGYIAEVFAGLGLKAAGDSGYFQPFKVSEGLTVDGSSFLSINGKILKADQDYLFMAYNPETKLKALPSIAMMETGMPWFINLADTLTAYAANPHYDLYGAIRQKAVDAAGKGATALFIYNTGTTPDGLQFESSDRSAPTPIPVIYLKPSIVKSFMADEYASLDIDMKCKISEQFRPGMNVMALLDRGAKNTVVIGAHFDHLGFGDPGSLPEERGHDVHNGADDNASGVAAVLELAYELKNNPSLKNNYLFIGFSGEEPGLLGSKYYVAHPAVPIEQIKYMINMDMVGRLKEPEHTLTIGGYGTSPEWTALYGRTGKKALYNAGFQYHFDSSGVGPSDHTSFYQKNIPVLFYFTGLHSDYHKSTDDADKINYEGETHVVKHVLSLIEAADGETGSIVFSPTRQKDIGMASASFKVTLGIMPDYSFNGEGVRVDGVSENRPAQKAGLQVGDVITNLGDFSIKNLEHYMQALAHFNKGDKTVVVVKRGAESLSREVVF